MMETQFIKKENQENVKKELYDFEISEYGIPEILMGTILIQAIKNYFDIFPEFYKYEGIFRIQGAFSDEEKYKKKLYAGDYESIITCKDPKVIASKLY